MTEPRTGPQREQPLACLTLPGSSSSARPTRDLLRRKLGGRFPPSVLDDLLLLVSELVANAAAATSQPIQLTVACDADMLKVELFDDSARLPQLGDFGPLAEEGRGLWLVDAIACAWGTVPHPYGKTVWFTLRI